MPDELFGVFKEEKGLAAGDTYSAGRNGALPERWKGRQFAAPSATAVTGHGKDAMLDKNLQLSTPGDIYLGQAAIQRMLQQRTGTPASDKPWRPSNPSARAGRASGALYGTFGPASTLLDTDASLGRNSGRPRTAPADHLRNFIVTTPKTGGPGCLDQARLMSGTAYVHIPDEYQRARILEKSLKKQARTRISQPFHGAAKPGDCFTTDMQLYNTGPSSTAKREASPSGARSASARPSSTSGRPVWRPSNPPARGPNALLGKIVHMACPDREARFRSKEGGAPAPKPFVPSGSSHQRLSMRAVNPYSVDARPADTNAASFL